MVSSQDTSTTASYNVVHRIPLGMNSNLTATTAQRNNMNINLKIKFLHCVLGLNCIIHVSFLHNLCVSYT
jgi:hypothetical protein